MSNLSKTERIMGVFGEGSEWKIGIENGKNIYEVMERVEEPFKNTPTGREKRNRVQSMMPRVQKIFWDGGLYFGAVKPKKASPKVYFIARTISEMGKIHNQIESKGNNLLDKKAQSKKLIQFKALQYGKVTEEEQKVLDVIIARK